MRMITRRLKNDERGMSLVFVGLGFMAMVFCAALAIDVGMFMTARSQAQNSADAGALAGATALVLDSYTDRSIGGPAVQNAVEASRANRVIHESVAVEPTDVTFPYNARTGQNDLVKVDVFRTMGRGNPLGTMLGRLMKIDTVDIAATATAQAAPANAITCVKPFIIPDRWREITRPPFDSMTSEYNYYSGGGEGNNRRPLEYPDIYYPATDVGNYTGYKPDLDMGTPMVIRSSTGTNVYPSSYFSWRMPVFPGMPTGMTGAQYYQWNICNCNPSVVHWGDLMVQEPGEMAGPTRDGVQCLLDKDPSAYWDDARKKVISTYDGPTPRIFPIPLYDPYDYETSGRPVSGREATYHVANWLGFFLEGFCNGNDICGRIVGIIGVDDGTGAPPGASFPKSVRLVQ